MECDSKLDNDYETMPDMLFILFTGFVHIPTLYIPCIFVGIFLYSVCIVKAERFGSRLSCVCGVFIVTGKLARGGTGYRYV